MEKEESGLAVCQPLWGCCLSDDDDDGDGDGSDDGNEVGTLTVTFQLAVLQPKWENTKSGRTNDGKWFTFIIIVLLLLSL